MPRKGENIRKRNDGRWEGRYKTTDPISGTKKYRSVYARTYREVKTKLLYERQRASICPKTHENTESGTLPHAHSVGEAAQLWLESMREDRKYSTYTKYRIIYEYHIKDECQSMDISFLNQELVRRILEKHQIRDGSLETSIYCVVNQIIAYANEHYGMNYGKVQKKKARKKGKPLEILSHLEQQQLLKNLYCDMDRNKLGIFLCLSLGLRLGEICALKWNDIDFDNKLLYVNRTVQRIAVEGKSSKTVLLEGEPKSVYSKRTVPLPEEILAFMQSFEKEGEYVVSKTKPTEPRTYENRFHKILRQADIPKCNFHTLRHTFATNCVDAGIDVKSLSEILGHADVNITLNRYVHPTLETKRKHLSDLTAIYGKYVGKAGES